MLYFAYGSNMLTRRLRQRVPSAHPLGAASADGWRMVFDKRSVDGSAKCTLAKSAGGTVHGALFEVAAFDRTMLDRAEGPGYRIEEIVARHGGSAKMSFSYVAKGSWLEPSLLPYDWYLELVVAGAREHGLPDEWVMGLLAIAAAGDPDAERAARHRELLR